MLDDLVIEVEDKIRSHFGGQPNSRHVTTVAMKAIDAVIDSTPPERVADAAIAWVKRDD